MTEVRVTPDLKNATAYRHAAWRARMPARRWRRLRRASGFSAPRAGAARSSCASRRPSASRSTPRFEHASRIDALLHRPEVARDLAPRAEGKKTEWRVRPSGSPVHGWLVLDKPLGPDLGPRSARCGASSTRQGRPWRHARSAGDRRSADRAGRGDQDRLLRHRRAEDSIASRCAGARRAITDDAEGEVTATSADPPRPRPRSRRRCRAFTGTLMQTPAGFLGAQGRGRARL